MAHQTSLCVACAHKHSSVWPASVPPLRPIPVEPQAMWRIHGKVGENIIHVIKKVVMIIVISGHETITLMISARK